MNLDLSGKTAIVCGSTQGLGFACAVEIALLGANVILMARNEDKLKLCLQSLDGSNGQKHDYIVADFADPQLVKAAMEQFEKAKNGAYFSK